MGHDGAAAGLLPRTPVAELHPGGATAEAGWTANANAVWRFIVRPIAVGGMLVGAAYTLFRMRKSLSAGLGRAFSELRQGAARSRTLGRTEQYMAPRRCSAGSASTTILMGFLYVYFSGQVLGGIVATLVMLIAGFFFATVSGSLVGFIGSSNNPISGLTLSTVIIAALLMVALGVSGTSGVVAILGVAAVVCVSSAVAGELLQDFKVGYILGGTPRTIQIVELVAVDRFESRDVLPASGAPRREHQGGRDRIWRRATARSSSWADGIDLARHRGRRHAVAAGLTGMALGIVMIMLQVKSPMLFAVGMYLPFPTTFAIFVGGIAKWSMETCAIAATSTKLNGPAWKTSASFAHRA